MSFLLTFSLFILSLLHHAHAYLETRPSQVFPITTGTSHFIMDLDYPQAFEVTITAFNKKKGDIGFCDTTPSKITPKLEWNGPIRLNDVPANSSDAPVERFYDNILYYKGWYFILDSLSFEITAIKDPRDSTTYVNIKSEFQNEKEDEQIEDTYFILDPDDEFIYIITRKDAYLYPLDKFFSSVKAKKTPPRLSEVVEGLPGYDMILSIRYYQNKLYVVADNEAQVFAISKNGDLTSQIKFDRTFFGNATEVAITDIVFKGNFAYVLDKLKGIYVVDISKSNSTEKITADKKYVFQPDDTRQVQKGQYIEIVQDSLHVVSSGGKNPFIFEYIIKGDMLSPTLEFNRKIELFQSIRDTFTDSNYLYLITGFFNMATKHSIPGRYHSENVEDYLAEYWPLVGARALTAQASGNVSKVAVINEDSLTILRFQESNPFISCNTGGLTEGSYTYSVHAVQRDCPAKESGDEEDYNAVCEINQDIEILIVKNTIDVGNIAESKKKVNLLLVGVGILGLLILVFVCLFRKYKVKYHLLEDRMKFHKLDEDNTEAGIKGGAKKEVDSHQDINPYNINIAAELRKEEQKEKRKSPHKSPIKEAQKVEAQPNAEFGDLKPLDIEEIYGHKAKAGEDDSF